ncbi:MAG: WbuC family cupin fold metalloprotein [Candidatus Eisenbacteria bacterium]
MHPSSAAGAVRYVTVRQLDRLAGEAALHPRGRINHNFHELDDPYQRMLNIVQPGSYVRPHRHRRPPKSESFVVVRGEMGFFVFDDEGVLLESRCIGPGRGTLLVDLLPGVWHTIAALESDTVIFEGKNGPYDPQTDKEFAPWAPPEGDQAAVGYLADLLARLERD